MRDYIPHHALIYLLLSLGFILLPHFERAPIALPIIWLTASLWQYKFFKQQWRLPTWPIKAILMAVAIGGIWLQFRQVLSLEFVTQLLLVTLLLKLLEMKTQRDVLVVLYLLYFSVVTQLLFSQNILSGAYVLVALTAITACLISLYQTHSKVSPWYALKLSVKMTIVSVPMLVVAFIVFPRLDPFWSVPSASPTAKTGISNSMSPGSFSNLLESNALALRVIFQGDLPPKSQLYWRTLVLDDFDGRTWKESDVSKQKRYQTRLESPDLPSQVVSEVNAIRYKVIQEPTQQPWLFTIDGLAQSSLGIYNTETRTLHSEKPIVSRIQYHLMSHLLPSNHLVLSESQRQLNTFLPQYYNPKIRLFSEQFRQTFLSDRAFIDGLLNKIYRDDFYYTPSPPKTGKHSVDDFWFTTQRGLCEHYSQALTVILRAVNIPARVVTGYQGGFLNPYDNYIMVREKNAHAWVEVWVDDKGWQRVDPTAAIAPERIESNTSNTFNANSDASDQVWGGSHSKLNYALKLQLKWDQINFFWQQKILNFNDTSQLKLLEKLLGTTSYLRIALFILISFMGFVALFFLVAYFSLQLSHKKNYSVEYNLYLKLLKKLDNKGISIKVNEGPVDLSKRLAILSHTNTLSKVNAEAAILFLQLYVGLMYKPDRPEKYKTQALADMQQQLKRL